jgi:hypothetical protein
MAQKVHVEILDDLDGNEASQTVPFALDGVAYEIDLSDENAEALRGEFARYVQAARRTGGRRTKATLERPVSVFAGRAASSPSQSNPREYNQQVRAWAAANGYEVAERGRLPGEMIAAYEAAFAAPMTEEKPKRAPRGRTAE